MRRLFLFLLFSVFFIFTACDTNAVKNIKETKKHHKLTLTFKGPKTSETAATNPFLDYRLNVTFTHGDQSVMVPGFYAADGNAAETSANSGSKWQVRFRPNAVGEWKYKVSFRAGKYIAISDDPKAGEPLSPDGQQGTFIVVKADAEGPLSKGKLGYVGERYLRFESGEYFPSRRRQPG